MAVILRHGFFMRNLTPAKTAALAILAFGLLAFVIYVYFLASRDALRFIGSTELDAIAHFSGGLFIALAAEWLFPQIALRRFLIGFAAIAFGWEVFEFLFNDETRWFYANYPKLWALDSAGDIIAAFLASYGYWVFARDRRQ